MYGELLEDSSSEDEEDPDPDGDYDEHDPDEECMAFLLEHVLKTMKKKKGKSKGKPQTGKSMMTTNLSLEKARLQISGTDHLLLVQCP